MSPLPILFQDEDFVAIDKPSGLLVHPTALARDRESCLSILRDQLGRWVYPVHRLDRGTSGVLVFALSSEAARELAGLFLSKAVRKLYYAVVRGFAAESGEILKPLRKSKEHAYVEASSRYERLATAEFPVAVGKYPSARYSLLRVETGSGRLHQIRKHMASISHPVVGDTVYGDGRHNRFFREHLGIHRLMLASFRFDFAHPRTGAAISIEAGMPEEMRRIFGTRVEVLSGSQPDH